MAGIDRYRLETNVRRWQYDAQQWHVGHYRHFRRACLGNEAGRDSGLASSGEQIRGIRMNARKIPVSWHIGWQIIVPVSSLVGNKHIKWHSAILLRTWLLASIRRSLIICHIVETLPAARATTISESLARQHRHSDEMAQSVDTRV